MPNAGPSIISNHVRVQRVSLEIVPLNVSEVSPSDDFFSNNLCNSFVFQFFCLQYQPPVRPLSNAAKVIRAVIPCACLVAVPIKNVH